MKTQTQLPLVVQNTINDAVRKLKASGCQFKVVAPDGTEWGDLKVEQPKKKIQNPNRPHGALRNYYDQFVDYTAPVGTVIQIPKHPVYTTEEIRSGVCAKLSTHWGKGTYTTAVSKAGVVEILRTA